MNEDKFYIIEYGKPVGPYSLEELRKRCISEETQVWSAEYSTWIGAGQLDALKPALVPLTGEETTEPVDETTTALEIDDDKEEAPEPEAGNPTPPVSGVKVVLITIAESLVIIVAGLYLIKLLNKLL